MKYFMVLANLTDEGRNTINSNPERIKQVNKTVEAHGTKIIAQYALFGPYDFLTILEAEDQGQVLKAAMELGSRGTMKTMTVPAIPIDEFIKQLKS
jgi:uncharacterized protein with GYD domain